MAFGISNKILVLGGLILIVGASMAFAARNMQKLSDGTWGGNHIRFEIDDGTVNIDFDCAHGSIGRPLTFDRQGRFSWRGSYTRERGGPIRLRDKINNLPATYSGSIKGDTMTLTVRPDDSSIEPQTFTLTRGSVGRVLKCK